MPTHIIWPKKSIVRYSVSNIRTSELKVKPLHSFSANCARGWNVLPLFVLSMWRLFLLCNFYENKKVSGKVVFSGSLNAYQLEGCFPVHLDNLMTVRKWYDFAMIWARRRCGEIPGQELFRVKRQKEAFDMWLMKLPYRQNKTHYRRKKH